MKSILSILAVMVALAASAQDVVVTEVTPRKDIKTRLAEPAQRDSLTVVRETVQIAEYADAAAIVGQNLTVEPKSVSGYRIVIFMSNTQTARRDAVAAQENFALLFPSEQSYLTYENPYFKVAVGNCTSQEEALILLGRLRGTFPKAFMMRENIAVGEFTR